MLNRSRSGKCRLTLKLEISLCRGLGGKCPGGLQAAGVEARRGTQSFDEARVENQVWREEEAGL